MGGKDKGSDYTPLRKVISSKVRHLILIGQARPIIRKDLDGCCLITECETMEEAIQTSYHLSQPGDSLVLSPACSSYDMFRDFEHRGEVFKELIRKLM
jgi:UDP-N-acetylmuramoylalanine--D-glutamate ligase